MTTAVACVADIFWDPCSTHIMNSPVPINMDSDFGLDRCSGYGFLQDREVEVMAACWRTAATPMWCNVSLLLLRVPQLWGSQRRSHSQPNNMCEVHVMIACGAASPALSLLYSWGKGNSQRCRLVRCVLFLMGIMSIKPLYFAGKVNLRLKMS